MDLNNFTSKNREEMSERGPQLFWNKVGRPESKRKENVSVSEHFPRKQDLNPWKAPGECFCYADE